MNKETFLWILQSALLYWDGVSEQTLIETYQINPYIARAGIKLCDYLKSIKIQEQPA